MGFVKGSVKGSVQGSVKGWRRCWARRPWRHKTVAPSVPGNDGSEERRFLEPTKIGSWKGRKLWES